MLGLETPGSVDFHHLKVDAGLGRASAAHRHSCGLQGGVMSELMTKPDT